MASTQDTSGGRAVAHGPYRLVVDLLAEDGLQIREGSRYVATIEDLHAWGRFVIALEAEATEAEALEAAHLNPITGEVFGVGDHS